MARVLNVVVLTAPIHAPADVEPERKVINYMDGQARRWLAKHCWWAFHNSMTVVTYPE